MHDIGNYRSICLLPVVYKLFTRAILNRISKTLDEGQPCEQAGFRRGFSTIDHIHTITKLIEVSQEYKQPLCLMFIDLKPRVSRELEGFDVLSTSNPSRTEQSIYDQDLTILQRRRHRREEKGLAGFSATL
ncbi:unnamed protein product [Heligmosomoides polygyrus]|uniref:Uncharacterized protein n=1 Tax=Heligmosomoides polygyrus TaxID=6339 RepID=A0A3P8J604_HELPZ|nr:unnamed protein product [Heligmosomoides polygyrus]